MKPSPTLIPPPSFAFALPDMALFITSTILFEMTNIPPPPPSPVPWAPVPDTELPNTVLLFRLASLELSTYTPPPVEPNAGLPETVQLLRIALLPSLFIKIQPPRPVSLPDTVLSLRCAQYYELICLIPCYLTCTISQTQRLRRWAEE